MTTAARRAVIVRRLTDYESLLARHATRGQAEFFLQSRGQTIEAVEAEHRIIHDVLGRVSREIPRRWRRTEVTRGDLDRFLFEPEDVVFAVGQDGLVANIAKYLKGQPVVGVNPLPRRFDGVLSRIAPGRVHDMVRRLDEGDALEIESRTMVKAQLDEAQAIYALNEIFIGHRSHQSARYRIRWHKKEERHSSSGVIVATGTGATGWARSINLSRGNSIGLPAPTDRCLAFFVREAFPSIGTGTALTGGLCEQQESLSLISEMNDGGVVFGDGIEDDRLAFDWGQTLCIGVADRTLNLVIG